jgi:hypothetical protein
MRTFFLSAIILIGLQGCSGLGRRPPSSGLTDVAKHFRLSGLEGVFLPVDYDERLKDAAAELSKKLTTGYAGEEMGDEIERIGVFRHPTFDWKENHERYVIHIYQWKSESAATKANRLAKARGCRTFRNGRFTISPSSETPEDLTIIESVFRRAVFR